MVVACIFSGLSVKQEVKGLTTNYITMHYPGRKPVYLQIFEFIGPTVSEFRFVIVAEGMIFSAL